ncbi:MAG: DUF1015 domain-containing protein [Bacteroidia bacterium]|jgi:uncharacterized protein (DUF1015 family)|nr:DUF1015 domain-containing protein [Bacteroidia bacterium]
MATVKPFKALRPSKEKAAQLSAPSYDSASRDKSYQELETNPYSYLHIVKPYLHFKGETKNPDKHFPLGLSFLEQFKKQGWLIKDEKDAYYIYRVIKGSNAYTGIIAAASVDDYHNNRILKHENTLTEKQNELADHIRWFKQLGNPVLLTYPDSSKVEGVIEHYIENHIPEYNFISPDQLKHNLWVVNKQEDVELIRSEFEQIPNLYIADGHHRSAGSAAYCEYERNQLPNFTGNELFNYFPVCLIPFSKLHIYEYHRLVKDTLVNSPLFMERIHHYFEVIPSGHLPVQPLKPKEFGLYFNHTAYLLKLKPEYATQLKGVLANLDVSIVEEFILKRIFEINDSKTDKRITFLDGTKGIFTLQETIDQKESDLAITLYQTSIDEVKQVADEHLIMPPKSTWIEPKLRTGLVIYETI